MENTDRSVRAEEGGGGAPIAGIKGNGGMRENLVLCRVFFEQCHRLHQLLTILTPYSERTTGVCRSVFHLSH